MPPAMWSTKEHHMTFVDMSAPTTPIMEVREVAAYKNSQPGSGCTIS